MNQHEPIPGSASVENVLSAVRAASEQLPRAELETSLAHARAASLILRTALANSPSPQDLELIGAMDIAEQAGEGAKTQLGIASEALTAYLTGKPVGGGEGGAEETAAMATGGSGAEEHPNVRAAREEAEHARSRLTPLLARGNVGQYTEELSKLSDSALCELLRHGVPLADETIVRRHEGLVWKLAHREYARRRLRAVDAEDLWVAGMVRFLEASKRYDPARGIELTTFAGSNARGAIEREASLIGHNVHIPVNMQYEIINKIYAENSRRLNEGLRPMTDEEIAAEFNLPLHPAHGGSGRRTVADIRRAMLLTTYLGSLDTGYSPREMGPGTSYPMEDIYTMESVTAGEQPRTDDEAIRRTLPAIIQQALDKLPEEEAALIRMRYGIGGTAARDMQDVADELGLNRNTMRRTEARALYKLYNILRLRQANKYSI